MNELCRRDLKKDFNIYYCLDCRFDESQKQTKLLHKDYHILLRLRDMRVWSTQKMWLSFQQHTP